MGSEAQRKCEEDTLYAEFLSGRLIGKELKFSEVAECILQSKTGKKFRNPDYPWLPEADLALCLSLDLFDFVLRCDAGMKIPCLRRMDV